jgi:predicted metal-dependent hydrolase
MENYNKNKMINSKKITVPGIGEVTFERSRKAKYVNISVKPFNLIRVAVPVGVSIAVAKEIAEAKAGWIKHQMHTMKQAEQAYADLETNHDPINRADAKKYQNYKVAG